MIMGRLQHTQTTEKLLDKTSKLNADITTRDELIRDLARFMTRCGLWGHPFAEGLLERVRPFVPPEEG